MKVGILNGPNLNLLGKREPEIYGHQGFESYLEKLQADFPEHEILYRQSNVEGELVNAIHDLAEECEGIIFNPAAFTHTSIALADAAKSIDCPIIEVHLSNVYQRESFRHKSYLSPAAKGVITGLGLKGYELALRALLA